MLANLQNPRNPIGEEPIYIETSKAALAIIDEFKRHEVCPILISQPQMGKTAVQIAVADSFVETCKTNNETYQIIVMINLSDNELLNQTTGRFRNAGLRDADIYHHSKLRKIKLRDVDRRLIIIDECHFALGDGKPFHEFMKRCGICYGKPINTWNNKNNYVLSVSATPYATVIREEIDAINNNPSFKRIFLEKNSEYFGLFDLLQKGRAKQSFSIIDNQGNVSENFKNYLNKLKPGYLLIRSKGEQCKSIKDYCKSKGIETEVYSSLSGDDFKINQLDSNISGACPYHLTVIIIKGALRAGKTLTSTRNIRGWLESESSNPDAIGQVVGRSLGYKDKKYNHSKHNDTFEIYCDLKSLEEAAKFYKNDNVPRGRNNKKSNGRKNPDVEILIFNQKNEGFDKMRELYSNDQLKLGKNSPTIDKLISEGCGKVSTNRERDICDFVIKNKAPSSHSIYYHFDGPHPNHKVSYDKLIKQNPDIVGKYILFVHKNTINNDEADSSFEEDLLANDCLLHNKNFIPKGIQNSSNTETVEIYEWKTVASEKEAKQFSGSKSVGKISTNQAKNICAEINEGHRGSSRSYAFHLDGPVQKYIESWNKMFKEHPSWKQGDIVCATGKTITTFTNVSDSLIKNGSLLKNEIN